MKPGYLNKTFIVLTLVAVLGFGTNAFALRGAGCPPEGYINQGQGPKQVLRKQLLHEQVEQRANSEDS